MGVLGGGYPGFFTVGDTQGLAALIQRAEGDGDFHRGLATWCHRLAPLVEPARERRAWRKLLRECTAAGKGHRAAALS